MRDALREQGWKVKDTGSVHDDFPDLVATHPRMRHVLGITLIEVKSHKATTKKGRLSEGQQAFADDFPVVVLRSRQDALEFHAAQFAHFVALGGGR